MIKDFVIRYETETKHKNRKLKAYFMPHLYLIERLGVGNLLDHDVARALLEEDYKNMPKQFYVSFIAQGFGRDGFYSICSSQEFEEVPEMGEIPRSEELPWKKSI